MALILDPNADDLCDFKETCPNTIIVGCTSVPDQKLTWRIEQDLVVTSPA